MKSGGVWRMMQLLGHTFLKKLTFVIRFIKTSLFCTKLRLTGRFINGCLFNRSLVPFNQFWIKQTIVCSSPSHGIYC